MIHEQQSPLAGKTVKLKTGAEVVVEDWWDRVAGKSWKMSDGNPAAMQYAVRIAHSRIPWDNEVLYGKVGWAGFLFHVDEIEGGVTGS